MTLAIADAGLEVSDIDGLTTFTMDTSSEIAVARQPRTRSGTTSTASRSPSLPAISAR